LGEEHLLGLENFKNKSPLLFYNATYAISNIYPHKNWVSKLYFHLVPEQGSSNILPMYFTI